MVKHIVMWKFKEENKQENIKQAKELLLGMVSQIDFLKELEVGINQNPSEAAYDMVLNTTFESFDDLDHYQNFPAHLEVAQFIRGVVDKRAVVDYEGQYQFMF